MRASFERAEPHLDLEVPRESPAARREELQQAVRGATTEQLGAMLEALERIRAGKTCQASA